MAAYRVDNGIDGAEGVARRVEEPLYVQLVGDVGPDGHSGPAAVENRVDGLLRRSLVVDVVDDDRIAELCKPISCRPADAS